MPRPDRPRPWPSRRVWWLGGGGLVVVVLVAGLVARAWAQRSPHAPNPVQAYGAAPTPTVDVPAFLTALPPLTFGEATPQPWDATQPFYILLLGVDDRPWVSNWGPPRSDTMLVVAYHPESQYVGVLSLPRDLKVDVPEWPAYPQKLNMAFAAGFAQGGPHAGARYALRVVNDLLGMDIHHYAVVNFAAFIAAVDALDGVKVDVEQPLVIQVYDTQTGTSRPVRLKPGRQTLNGAMTLGYVRFRSDAQGDFGRMARQQQVLWGVYERLREPGTWGRLLPQLPTLYNQLREGLWTNLPLSDAVALGWQIRQVPPTHFRAAVVTQQEAPAQLINGVYVLIPQPEALHALRDTVLLHPEAPTPTPPAAVTPTSTPLPAAPTPTLRPSPTPTPNWWPQARREMARIALFNAAGEPGLACRTAAFLRYYGFWVVYTGNAGEYRDRTLLINAADKPATLALLQQMLGLEPGQIVHRAALPEAPENAEIALYLGADWAARADALPSADECP